MYHSVSSLIHTARSGKGESLKLSKISQLHKNTHEKFESMATRNRHCQLMAKLDQLLNLISCTDNKVALILSETDAADCEYCKKVSINDFE